MSLDKIANEYLFHALFPKCTTLSSQSSLASNEEHHTPRRLEIRQLNSTRDNQPQVPEGSQMYQARVQTFGITSTENASLKPSDLKKKPPVPEKPKLERPSIKTGENFEKKAEDQKALSGSSPTRRQLNLTTDNQPQIPQRSQMTQAQVHVSTLGSASTETVPIKQRPIPKRRTLERPRMKAEEVKIRTVSSLARTISKAWHS
ncbi:uncharacterized protein LOC134241703 [Saccostrea cucullata]|uniref:uncharacterized protein LOC134241703 n=1 Tax=Saccostrea cuccullata TaxID=36930 RepID=UPI002ED29A6D